MTVIANTKLLNVRNATDYFNPFKDVSNGQYYVFAAKHTPWANASVASITDSVKETEYTIFEEMIFGKTITPDDVKPMVDRYDWTTGTVYSKYDDQDANLFSKNFFVMYPEGGSYHVFKCIDNNGSAQSTSPPLFSQTSADDTDYMTADGYRWKYMYSISSSEYSKFATSSYIPLIPNTYTTAFAANGSIDSIIVEQGGNNYFSSTSGYFSTVAVGGNSQIHAINTGSSNNGFYTGSALYISTGTGSGQVREITNYLVSGNQYLVTVNNAFSPQPDLSSQYQIAPNVKILGDGSNAAAISVVNTATKAIQRISIISGGLNYTYANVSVIGNTGTLLANSATVRAIISPKGGHGYDPEKELNANKIGISVSFANSEANTISITNDYSRVGVIKNPLYANVEVSFTTANGVFSAGETVIQTLGVNTALNIVATKVQDYVYNTGNYSTLNLTAATTLAVNDSIYQTSPTTTNGVVIALTGNTIVVRRDSGSFTPAATIYKVGALTTNNVINTVSAGFSNTIYGLDSGSNTIFTFSSTNNTIDVFVNGQKIYNKGALPSNTAVVSYSVNSTAVLLWNKTVSNSDTVSIKKYITSAAVSNAQYSSSGQVVSSNSTVVRLTNVSGLFAPGNILGLTSGVGANAISVSGPNATFNQALRLTAAYQAGSNTFSLDDYCQQDTPGIDGAYAYIQDIQPVGNGSYYFYLTGVKGEFESGSTKTIQSVNGLKVANVSQIRPTDLIKYSGDILYAENINTVSRANNQTETIKLVIRYY